MHFWDFQGPWLEPLRGPDGLDLNKWKNAIWRAADLGDRLAHVDKHAAQVVDDGLLRALGVAKVQAGPRGALPQGQGQQPLPRDDVAAAEGPHGGPREQLPLQEGGGGERA